MKKLYHLLFFILLFGMKFATAQTVLDPNDPIVVYNPASPPTQPAWGSIGKWVKTNRVGWVSTSYKCYIYKGLAFRLKFPKNYNPADTKKYPLIMFFHGLGELGTIYDNEYQLLHGGEIHKNKVDDGSFDGFLFYPQSQSGYFGAAQYDIITELINNFFVPQINVDPFRIMVEGLSAGGTSTWEFTLRAPKLIAGFTPISAANGSLKNSLDIFKYTPLWQFQGAIDPNPTANIAQDLYASAQAVGGNMKLTVYAGQGHGVWDLAWNEADYFPFMSRANKANPWPLFGRTEFCTGDLINVTLGLTAGFDGYEWRKDGALISGATSNTLTVTSLGTYDARVKSGSLWSQWSPIPVQIKIKAPTVSPNIQISGLMSKVIPAPDGKDSVVLQVPTGYTSYVWKNAADTSITLGTQNTLAVRQAGNYVIKVTELYGCSSSFSAPFTVIPANGSQAPAPANSLVASGTSKTGVTLNWNKNVSQTYSETGFEVYRAATAGGPYTLIALVNANVLTYEDHGLNPNTQYFYIVRAVNNSGAAAVSNEANATTQYDSTPPIAPGNVTATGTTRTSVTLSWVASTDDVAVDKYDIYINGVKSYTINGDQTSFTAYGLTNRQIYTFIIKARDAAGNVSPASNQASAAAISKGLNYKYYLGAFNTLPDFTTLTPDKTGTTPTVDLSVRTQETNYAILWQGYINIPVTGNYTFETYSDDGSKLYIGNYSPTATALVNNDGLHGTQYREGTINLTKGSYPISISFFQQGGGQTMQIFWKNTANGVTTRQEIPASFFADTLTLPAVPVAPSNTKATAVSYNKINLTWNDNSNNETGFEIYRAAAQAGPYNIVATTAANATTYADSLLTAQTTYYYQVKAINKYGNSGVSLSDISGLRYDYYEASYTTLPDFNTLTPVKSGITPNVNLDIRQRDVNYALKFSGYINIPTTGQYTFYTSSDDGSKLYIDGFDNAHTIVNNNFLQGTTERSGVVTLTAGRHQIYVTYFQQGGGQALTASYQRTPAIPKQNIPASAFENVNVKATTLALPPLPAAPTVLTGTAVTSRVNLKWNDNSNNETGFEIYRSMSNNTSYLLLTTKTSSDSTTAVYSDTSIIANTSYYYKVRAKNGTGTSAYSNELSIITVNTVPVLQNLSDKGMRYGTQLVIPVIATDPDNETLTLTAINLPAFGVLADNGNGTGSLTFNPTLADQGIYSNIQVKVTDQHGGIATKSFTLTINDNYPPVLNPISNVTTSTGSASQVNLTATDNNLTDVLTWSNTGLPAFATFTATGNNAQIQLNPGYSDGGLYPVTVTINDGKGGVDVKSFTISVTATNPGKVVFINFNDGTNAATGYWNNVNKPPVQNDVYANLKDSTNTATSISMKVITPWQNQNNGTNNSGATTNNNTGIYPDKVIISAWWSGAGAKQTLQLSGLTLGPNFTYNITFFGSRGGVSDNRTTLYSINGTSVSLNAANNTTNTVTIKNIVPDSTGAVLLDIINGTGSSFAYLNAMIIEAAYDDHAAPAAPKNIAAQLITGAVKVNWSDAAYNETGYEVHRATDPAGPFTLLNPAPTNANATTYNDSTVHGSTRYYYKVRAINSYGSSAFSDTASVQTANIPPVLAPISNITAKTGDTTNVTVSATGDVGTIITLSATGLPSFATFTDNGNGNGVLSVKPTSSNVGVYNNVSITATDNKGGTAIRTFSITVTTKSLASIYVNFNEVNPVGAPWNSFNTFPQAGKSISNIKNGDGVATGITLTLVDAIEGANAVGATTGNNSGVFPDSVMQTAYFESSANTKRIRITGLPAGNKYNLIFFASRGSVADNRNTDYTVGAQTVTLNAASNTSNTVQINGLSPDATGMIEFSFKRGTGSSYGYIGALVIQSYADNGLPLAPSNLKALGKSRNSIALNWQDNATTGTAMQVWRSATVDGAYSLITTLPAHTTSYLDNGLSENTGYFYKVRVVDNTLFSDYSNVASGYTYAYSVYVNINRDNPAGSPWNNTNAAPMEGARFSNLLTEQGDNSGLALSVVKNFSGDNPFGVITGNNSGIYPDNVLRSSWWIDGNGLATMRVEGLNQSQAYTFTFLGSRDGAGDRTTIYTVNGQSVSLNSSNNSTQTVQLDNIRPDQDGYVLISMTTGPQAQYGYINSLVISSYGVDPGTSGGNTLLQRISGGALNMSGNTLVPVNTQLMIKEPVINAYPNPFQSFVYLSLDETPKNAKMIVKLFDTQGRLLFAKVLGNTGGGASNERLDFGPNLIKGVYFLQIMANDKMVKTIKLIRN
ncbi:fibronectin type III domain-containing protein [Chitinophaga sp. MM2321]|uniref:fibronectin type III domain-containing protein n=1 Tax=Chitinophaga sp. MM2321 TaxID=3137178 RepID=UPI0032D591A5